MNMSSRNPLDRLSDSFRIKVSMPPSTQHEIEALRASSELSLPQDYVDLVSSMTEVEISVEDLSYIRIWGAARAQEMNEAYELQVHIPRSLAVGDDEGGSALVLMTGNQGFGLYLVGLGELDVDDAQYIAPSLSEFLVKGVGLDVIR